MGRASLFGFLLGFEFLVELDGLGRGRALQAALLVFVGGVPVDEVLGNFLPLAALGAVVADAVSFDFVLGGELVGAVFEDEALGEGLGEGYPAECGGK